MYNDKAKDSMWMALGGAVIDGIFGQDTGNSKED